MEQKRKRVREAEKSSWGDGESGRVGDGEQ